MAKNIRIKMNFEGADQIVKRLKILPEEVSKQHMRESAQVGAEVIRQAAEDNARKGKYATGDLAESIVAEATLEKGGKVEFSIGPDKKHFYGLFVELGHKIVRGRKKAEKKVVGNAPPHPFLRPALDEKKNEAEQAIAEELRRRLKL